MVGEKAKFRKVAPDASREQSTERAQRQAEQVPGAGKATEPQRKGPGPATFRVA